MFKALEKHAYTIKIGNDATAAKYNIPTQADVLPVLESIMFASTEVVKTV
jgi:hypothetical protein